MNSHLVIGEAGVEKAVLFPAVGAREGPPDRRRNCAQGDGRGYRRSLTPGQTGLAIGQVAQLQSQIISHEVQLDAMRNSATDQNPDVIRLNNELQSLREQLRQMESAKPGKGRNPGDILLTPRALPADQLEFLRKQRDVQYHTLIFDLIARQFEAARLDEAKASPVIQVFDPAEPPDRKSSPYRALVDIDRRSSRFHLRMLAGNRLLRLWSGGGRRGLCPEVGPI